jgi:hypothetical protein
MRAPLSILDLGASTPPTMDHSPLASLACAIAALAQEIRMKFRGAQGFTRVVKLEQTRKK